MRKHSQQACHQNHPIWNFSWSRPHAHPGASSVTFLLIATVFSGLLTVSTMAALTNIMKTHQQLIVLSLRPNSSVFIVCVVLHASSCRVITFRHAACGYIVRCRTWVPTFAVESTAVDSESDHLFFQKGRLVEWPARLVTSASDDVFLFQFIGFCWSRASLRKVLLMI